MSHRTYINREGSSRAIILPDKHVSRSVQVPRRDGIFSAGSLCATHRLGNHNVACLHAMPAEQRPGCRDSRQCHGGGPDLQWPAPRGRDPACACSAGARMTLPRARNPKGSRLIKTGTMTGGPANAENGRDYWGITTVNRRRPASRLQRPCNETSEATGETRSKLKLRGFTCRSYERDTRRVVVKSSGLLLTTPASQKSRHRGVLVARLPQRHSVSANEPPRRVRKTRTSLKEGRDGERKKLHLDEAQIEAFSTTKLRADYEARTGAGLRITSPPPLK